MSQMMVLLDPLTDAPMRTKIMNALGPFAHLIQPEMLFALRRGRITLQQLIENAVNITPAEQSIALTKGNWSSLSRFNDVQVNILKDKQFQQNHNRDILI